MLLVHSNSEIWWAIQFQDPILFVIKVSQIDPASMLGKYWFLTSLILSSASKDFFSVILAHLKWTWRILLSSGADQLFQSASCL